MPQRTQFQQDLVACYNIAKQSDVKKKYFWNYVSKLMNQKYTTNPKYCELRIKELYRERSVHPGYGFGLGFGLRFGLTEDERILSECVRANIIDTPRGKEVDWDRVSLCMIANDYFWGSSYCEKQYRKIARKVHPQ